MTDTRKVALVTGGNKGIGFEAARQLAQLDHRVVIGARDQHRGQAAAEQLQSEGAEASYVVLDVSAHDTVTAAIAVIEQQYGRLDVLINNAGTAPTEGAPSEVALDTLRDTYETNVFGLVAVTQAALPLLRRAVAGRIVNLSSGAGSLTVVSGPDWRPEWNGLAYNTSKSAVNAVTVAFATELRATPIKVNAVNPGYTRTDMSPGADRPASAGAAVVVRYATLPADGPTGGFFDENGPVAW
ncbi:SDR family oxidoreductase [Kribbella jejuensis]|uniref:NAD(P)-dependent dehydrogenase (Short-subunit alcohol dehydrogenase family) n=1 Tax=Kribbella jejuensis TaxID=236068 RepID=A0A542EPY9_9ACTN|nr:SDR family oxidoreductase [Kribbella jejuensis]TQJ17411.1 NAD(P)-dependent dehydrogenase (short-subunit alcohol dehydrogenase family) [Kribbella jejuensis]